MVLGVLVKDKIFFSFLFVRSNTPKNVLIDVLNGKLAFLHNKNIKFKK